MTASHGPVVLIHGGAGVIQADLRPDRRATICKALSLALRKGYAILRKGGAALDAVTAAVVALEDAPCFNAGKGAVFTHDGHNELDAAIMRGVDRAAAAVAGIRLVRNPVLLARAVLEHSPHVMLIGEGAEAFAAHCGLQRVEPAYFHTEARWEQLQRVQQNRQYSGVDIADTEGAYFGTVGAVALDRHGELAAATSTGGMTDKRWGRVGDSPIIGAGTYADAHCAVSGTGWGEYYIRSVAAHAICVRVAAGQSVEAAATVVINQEIPAMGGSGGAIVLGADGSYALPFNTEGMYRAWMSGAGIPHVAIGNDEEKL